MTEPESTSSDRLRRLFLEYEVAGSWWAKNIGWSPLQKLAGWYFAKKVNRKYGRYLKFLEARKFLEELKVERHAQF